MSSESARKQGFKLRKIEIYIYIRNVDRMFNKEKLKKYCKGEYLLSGAQREDRDGYDQ